MAALLISSKSKSFGIDCHPHPDGKPLR